MAQRGNPNWTKGMKRTPGNGQGPGGSGKYYKPLRDLREVIAETSEELGFDADPTVLMSQIAAGKDVVGVAQAKKLVDDGVIDPSTDQGKERIAAMSSVSLDTRLDAAKAVGRYIRPVLAQTQISGPNDGPIVVASFPATELMGNDEIVKFVENMQIALAEKASALDGEQGISQAEETDQE